MDFGRALTDGGTQTVGCGIAAPDDHNLPIAGGHEFGIGNLLPQIAADLLAEVVHRVDDPFHFVTGDRERARIVGSGGQADCIETGAQFVAVDVGADVNPGFKFHAFLLQLADPAEDYVLFQLEVGDSQRQQPARVFIALVHDHPVSATVQLLRRRQSGRPGADHRDAESGPFARRFGPDEPVFETPVGDFAFDVLDRDRVGVDRQHAGLFARRRADAAGKFREIVGRVQDLECFAPALPEYVAVEVRNLVPQRAGGMAERYPATHAPRRLPRRFVRIALQVYVTPVADARIHPALRNPPPRVAQEPGRVNRDGPAPLRHAPRLRCGPRARPARACNRAASP